MGSRPPAQPSLALQSPPRDPGQLRIPSETRLPWCRVGVIGVPSLKGARGQRGLIPKARVCLRHIGGLGSALISLLGPACFLTFNPGARRGAVLSRLSGSSPLASLDFDVTPRGTSPSAHRPPWERASQRRWRPRLRSAGEGRPPRVGWVGVVTVTLSGHSPALVGSGKLLKSACALLRALPAHTHRSKGSCRLCSATSWPFLPGGRPMRGVWKQVGPGSNPGWVTRLRAQCRCSCLVSLSACEMGWRRPSGPSGVGWGQESTALHGHPPSGRGPLLGAPALPPLAPQALLGGGGGVGGPWRQRVLGVRPT